MKTIAKDKITDVLDFLAGEFQLFAPVSADGLVTEFGEIERAGEVKLDFYNTKSPVKKLFFPQAETMYSYTKDGGRSVGELKPKKPRVIFGLRPCGAKSLELLDMVFDTADTKDPYYAAKRKNTTLFVLACNNPQSSCFCTSFGIGPGSKDGADVLVIELEDKYLFEAVTEKGSKILKDIPYLTKAAQEDKERAEKSVDEAEKKITRKIKLDGLAEKLKEIADEPIWEELSAKCLTCGACTFSCPTCHCFDIIDETCKDCGSRIRIWDSCMNPTFTLEASGHDPRSSKKDRLRQRIMHKFSYFVENNGQFSCVGCGRCLRCCPAGMNIVGVIEKINNAK